MSESVPTSVTSFAHRRSRADSAASFTYYPEDDYDQNSTPVSYDEAVLDDDEEDRYEEESVDLEAGELAPMRRVSSGNIASVHDHLFRSDSARTDGSASGRRGRTIQKRYIVYNHRTICVT